MKWDAAQAGEGKEECDGIRADVDVVIVLCLQVTLRLHFTMSSLTI